jgi:hypothetical protein
MIISRIISKSVATKAKPDLGQRMKAAAAGWQEIFMTVGGFSSYK